MCFGIRSKRRNRIVSILSGANGFSSITGSLILFTKQKQSAASWRCFLPVISIDYWRVLGPLAGKWILSADRSIVRRAEFFLCCWKCGRYRRSGIREYALERRGSGRAGSSAGSIVGMGFVANRTGRRSRVLPPGPSVLFDDGAC